MSFIIADVILSERGPERFKGPKERESFFGAGSGVASEESASPALYPTTSHSEYLYPAFCSCLIAARANRFFIP
jgi:hypothetical protein